MNQIDRNQLATNYQTIQQNISKHVTHTQHSIEDIKLIAVTKTVSSTTMRQLLSLGLNRFGENRHTVLLEKLHELADLKEQIEWHFIGRLQSRQVKSIINEIDYLHSLDRLSLAQEIQKRATHPIKCFLQVNVSGEASKAGIAPNQVLPFIQSLAQFDKIIIVGLMTMAPIDASSNEIKQQFISLKALQEEVALQSIPYAPCSETSMGMSQDYPLAIEAGASYIRVGSAFFRS